MTSPPVHHVSRLSAYAFYTSTIIVIGVSLAIVLTDSLGGAAGSLVLAALMVTVSLLIARTRRREQPTTDRLDRQMH